MMNKLVPLDIEVACGQRNVVDESIRNSIEVSFNETLDMMQRNKETFSKIRLQELTDLRLKNPFAATEDKIESHFIKMKSYSKAYDDSRLRPAASGEKSCVMGTSCECNLMAIDNGKKHLGFTGVVFDDHYQKCLLCIRVETLMNFYKKLINSEVAEDNILPFTNIVDRLGEYNREMCIHPNGRNNICGPFVIHQRNMYRYSAEKTIEQLPNVNFCIARNTDDSG